MSKNIHHNSLTREQKTGFVLLLTFGILTVGLGFLQMRNTIYGPFAFIPGSTGKTTTELLEDENVKLQSIDTDHDGLNDYEELYFYQTSPYLPDTDSDGISDKVELDEGKDPVCPEGTVCNDITEFSQGDTTDITVGDLEAPIAPVGVLELLNGSGEDDVIDVEKITTNADQIRELLLQTGKLSSDQIDSIGDEELLAIVDGYMVGDVEEEEEEEVLLENDDSVDEVLSEVVNEESVAFEE
jgi:hypothetical protein